MPLNKISTEVTRGDREIAARKRQPPAAYAREILASLETAAPYNCTFVHEIPQEHRATIEAKLKTKFELWANTWIAPECREIIAQAERLHR